MSAGTTVAALAINTSTTGVVVLPTASPLGQRWKVAVVTATGRPKEVALLADKDAADAAAWRIGKAIDNLRAAGEIVQAARNRQAATDA